MTNYSSIVERLDILLLPDSSKVILRSFRPRNDQGVIKIISRIMALDEKRIVSSLDQILKEFSSRHFDIRSVLLNHYQSISRHMITDLEPSPERKMLIGAYFTNEYSFQAAALFNPSIVPHPDQSDLPDGALRFIMSLRAVGEGHISSLTFRAGIIHNRKILLDDCCDHSASAIPIPNPSYDKKCFSMKLFEMGFDNDFSQSVLKHLDDNFSMHELKESIKKVVSAKFYIKSQTDILTSDKIIWLAQSNYEAVTHDYKSISECVIFPASSNEQNGIEDARFVLFTEDDGTKTYYATYTAYDGKVILPQFLETKDFHHFNMITLNGRAATNKGMALFPRKINEKYAMLSRQDNENILIMYSHNLHFWDEAQIVCKPTYQWEFVQIGNCGSPMETGYGWLVITHGVGAMRKYCIGAILLDLHDPSKVIGRLKEPLIISQENEKDGYVPNVVYSCGSLIHNGDLILPYAISDRQTTIALIGLEQLIKRMM